MAKLDISKDVKKNKINIYEIEAKKKKGGEKWEELVVKEQGDM